MRGGRGRRPAPRQRREIPQNAAQSPKSPKTPRNPPRKPPGASLPSTTPRGPACGPADDDASRSAGHAERLPSPRTALRPRRQSRTPSAALAGPPVRADTGPARSAASHRKPAHPPGSGAGRRGLWLRPLLPVRPHWGRQAAVRPGAGSRRAAPAHAAGGALDGVLHGASSCRRRKGSPNPRAMTRPFLTQGFVLSENQNFMSI